MAGLFAGPPAIRLRHSTDSPRGARRGYAPSLRCDSPANEYRGARDVHTPTASQQRLLCTAQIILRPDVGLNEAEQACETEGAEKNT